jgi:hypothetical protein
MFSELQWMIGVSNALPISLQYFEPRESIGLVVYPSWLFVMICIVPPISNLGTFPNTND